MTIRNAKIESTSFSILYGTLSGWINFTYGDASVQSMGGLSLYLPPDFTHHAEQPNVMGHWMYRIMQVAGVNNWEDLPGKIVQIKLNDDINPIIVAIGHILKDDWFNPKEEFQKLIKDTEE